MGALENFWNQRGREDAFDLLWRLEDLFTGDKIRDAEPLPIDRCYARGTLCENFVLLKTDSPDIELGIGDAGLSWSLAQHLILDTAVMCSFAEERS